MSIKVILKDLIIKYQYYLILSYILTICGIIINSYINITAPDIYFTLYIIIISIFFSNVLLINQIKFDDKTKTEYINLKLYKWSYIKSLKRGTQEKFINYLKINTFATLILIPIIIGGWYHAIYIHTSPSYLKLISISFEMTLMYTMLIRGEIFHKTHKLSIIYSIIIMAALIIMVQPIGLNFLDKLLDYIISNSSNAFTILIAIIMLCVGLSALSFGYCSILKEGSKTRNNMKRNGEGYFIAAILSMIAILLLFLTSIIKKYVNFMSLSNLEVMSFDFIILNIYSVFVIMIFTFMIYASYCMLKCSILSLKELKLFERYL